ncbi:hypothetical protein O6H91_19G021500 [Diphasiastrum complanatum]|uniref:Uncharacterized protein n=1 Tax=Diphasiastrum complanatum TaxID=34168 RepID=A0ACC2ATA5_DIPCM|nr:hypothetical protein O6H91_19G021500 [Diphasiastrum complanatum]
MESIEMNRSNAQLVHINLQKKIVRSRLESVKVVLRSLMLGILLGLVSWRVALALFNCYSSSKPMSADTWQSLNRAFSRHILFFIVNAVVLLVLVPSGFFSQSQGAQGAQTAHYDLKKLRAPAQQWKTSESGRFQNRPNLLEPETEGKELSLALAKMTQDQTKQCLLPKQHNTTGHLSSTKTMHSPVVHRNDLINGELEDLNGRIEAFIAKVRREMKQQERQDAPLDRYRSGR